MDLNEYQELAQRTATDTLDGQGSFRGCAERAIGIVEEAGEVAGLVKKMLFHGHPLDRSKLAEELGDLAWYVAVTAASFGLTLEEVAIGNIAKLRVRYPEGFSEEASRNRSDK